MSRQEVDILFVLSKILWWLVTPSNLLMVAFAAMSVWIGCRARSGRSPGSGVYALAGLVAIAIAIGITPVGTWPLQVLEMRFAHHATDDRLPTIAGIIVLGGAIGVEWEGDESAPAFNDAADRITAMLTLAQMRPDVPIVFTGGNGSLDPKRPSEAALLKQWLSDSGLAVANLRFEGRSRNTRENALYTRDLLQQEGIGIEGRWLVVSSAFHMPRAIGVFRQVGFDPVAYPVDSRLADWGGWSRSASRGWRLFDLAAHEWAGLIAYRMLGYSSELWPSPEGGRAKR